MAETVRIGLSGLTAWVLKTDNVGVLAYGEPFAVAPAVSASITPETSDDSFYADDIALISNQTISAVTVEIETADIKDEVVSKLLGVEIDQNGVVIDNINNTAPQIALGFRSLKTDGSYKYVVLYKGAFGIGDDEYATKEDSLTFQTTSISGTFLPTIHNGNWRASVNSNSDAVGEGVIEGWFEEVYGATSTDPVTP